MLAVPSLTTLIVTQQVRTGAADLQSSLYFARSEALKRAANVEVVPVGDDWKNGWKVQLADGTVLRNQPALNPACRRCRSRRAPRSSTAATGT